MSEVNMYAKKVRLWQSEEQSSLEIKKTEHAKLVWLEQMAFQCAIFCPPFSFW